MAREGTTRCASAILHWFLRESIKTLSQKWCRRNRLWELLGRGGKEKRSIFRRLFFYPPSWAVRLLSPGWRVAAAVLRRVTRLKRRKINFSKEGKSQTPEKMPSINLKQYYPWKKIGKALGDTGVLYYTDRSCPGALLVKDTWHFVSSNFIQCSIILIFKCWNSYINIQIEISFIKLLLLKRPILKSSNVLV